MEADCEKIEELKAAIGTFADFPKPGIVFKYLENVIFYVMFS